LVRTLKFLGLIAVLAAVFPVLGGAAPARTTANSVAYQDSTGEDPQGPDITSTTVSNDNTGLITFDFKITNHTTVPGDMLGLLFVDTDNNPATGDPTSGGADYAIQLFQNQVDLFQWDGTNYSRSASGPAEATLIFTNAPTGPVIKISALELGNTKKFNFAFLFITGIVTDPATGDLDLSKAHVDAAPDPNHGLYSYEVKVAPLKLLATKFRKIPGRPIAGRPFSVRIVAFRSDTGVALQNGTVKCTARVGGRSLTARTHKIANKEAQCAWAIPASARGRTIRGSISVVFEGLKVTKTFTAYVG